MGGLSNGGVGPGSRKGISDVSVRGKQLSSSWNHSWVFRGDEERIFSPDSTGRVPWQPFDAATDDVKPVTWFKASFDLPKGGNRSASTMSFALDLSSMWKGIAY